jgi:hypothetical protein
MVGGGAVLAMSVLDNATTYTETPGTAEFVATFSMGAVGALLLLAGAVAAHARYGDAYGRLGLLGAVVAGLGFLSMAAGGLWSYAETAPAADGLTSGGAFFLGLLVAVIGSVLLAAGLRRVPRATRAVRLFAAAPVLLVATFVVGEAVNGVLALGIDVVWLLFVAAFCAGWIALGDSLRGTPETTPVETTAPVA